MRRLIPIHNTILVRKLEDERLKSKSDSKIVAPDGEEVDKEDFFICEVIDMGRSARDETEISIGERVIVATGCPRIVMQTEEEEQWLIYGAQNLVFARVEDGPSRSTTPSADITDLDNEVLVGDVNPS